ncbi:MAG: RNA methyltransferase [Clostridiales bacterium]|nr:RNA methyltransferase [Clostridiales bacterium]
MREIFIKSKNADYQRFEVLRSNRNKRYRYGEFLVEGVRSLKEAAACNWEIHSLIYPDAQLSDWARGYIESTRTNVNYRLTPELMRELSGKTDPSEMMAIVAMRDDSLDNVKLSKNPFIVLFDRPSNRGNLGTLIRSCDALGADLLLITGHAVDLYDPEVVVSAMGSFFKLPVVRIDDNTKLDLFINRLRNDYPDFSLLGTTAHKQCPIWKAPLDKPFMLMIGNETMGLNAAFKEKCDYLCTIPMAEDSYASSFNVACAATAMMYEAVRQRNDI